MGIMPVYVRDASALAAEQRQSMKVGDEVLVLQPAARIEARER